jgi:hypothetical protein
MNKFPAMCWLLVTLVIVGACARKTGPTSARAETQGPGAAVDVHAGADLPPVCDEYRRKLLKCMDSDHFPKWAKEGQRSALEQMLSIVRQEQSRKDDPEAAKAAADNCRDSLATLVESGKESCPGVL